MTKTCALISLFLASVASAQEAEIEATLTRRIDSLGGTPVRHQIGSQTWRTRLEYRNLHVMGDTIRQARPRQAVTPQIISMKQWETFNCTDQGRQWSEKFVVEEEVKVTNRTSFTRRVTTTVDLKATLKFVADGTIPGGPKLTSERTIEAAWKRENSTTRERSDQTERVKKVTSTSDHVIVVPAKRYSSAQAFTMVEQTSVGFDGTIVVDGEAFAEYNPTGNVHPTRTALLSTFLTDEQRTFPLSGMLQETRNERVQWVFSDREIDPSECPTSGSAASETPDGKLRSTSVQVFAGPQLVSPAQP